MFDEVFTYETRGKGLYEITTEVRGAIGEADVGKTDRAFHRRVGVLDGLEGLRGEVGPSPLEQLGATLAEVEV